MGQVFRTILSYCMVSFTQNILPPQIQVVIIAVASFAYLLLGRCTQSKPPDATFYHHRVRSWMQNDKSLNLALVLTSKGDELIGFPDTVLASLAEFLTKTERALVAVAMTASSKSWRESNWRKRPLDASSVMIAVRPLNEINVNRRMRESYEWDSFDFRDIVKSLA